MPKEPIATFTRNDLAKFIARHLDEYAKGKERITILCAGFLYFDEYLAEWLQKKKDAGVEVLVHIIYGEGAYRRLTEKKIFKLSIIETAVQIKQFNKASDIRQINIHKEFALYDGYDVIFNLHFLHNSSNWRLTLTRLFKNLKKGGLFVFSEVQGTYSILDGNFKNAKFETDDGKKLFEVFKQIDRKRNDNIHYWRPEISFTNYSEVKNQAEPLFEETIDREASLENKGVKEKWEFGTIECITINEGFHYGDLINDGIFSYFNLRGRKDEMIDIATNADHDEILQGSLHGQITRIDQVTILKGFIRNKFDALKDRHWDYSALLKDIDHIKDNVISSLGKKAIDIFISHDVFFPEYTRYLAIFSWNFDLADHWSYPIHLACEKTHSNYEIFSFFNIYRLFALDKFSPIKLLNLLFKESLNKFPIYIVLLEDDYSFESFAAIQKFTTCRGSDTDEKIAYSVDFTRKDNIQKMNIVIMQITAKKIIAINEDFFCLSKNIDPYQSEFLVEEFESILDVVSRYTINSDFEQPYESVKKAFGNLTINCHHIPITGCEDMAELSALLFDNLMGGDRANQQAVFEEGKSILDWIITIAVLFQLRDSGHRLGFLPSSIINNKNTAGSESLTGLGGVVLYERILPAGQDYNIVSSLFKARDIALEQSVNLIFYKAAIASYVNRDFYKSSLRSAVAAITARSGSHTLGSHVLPEVCSRLGNLINDGTKHFIADPVNSIISVATKKI